MNQLRNSGTLLCFFHFWQLTHPCKLGMIYRLLITLLLAAYSLPSSSTPSEERKQEIGHIVQQDCGSCHGLTLKGGLGPSLDPVRLRQYPENYLEVTILHGRPGTPMPPWSAILTEDEIHYIATQLRAGTWYVP